MKNMENFYILIGTSITVVALIAGVSFFSGTMIWLTWDVIEIFFSPLTFLPEDPTWWECIKVSFLISVTARLFWPKVEIKKEK